VRISVALATWRGAEFLQAQLDSLAAQTRLPDELVASDDASDDATPELLEAFAADAPFEVRVLRQDTNLGYAGNFNRALAACTGDLIFPCDQDDFWFTDKLAQMERWAQHTPKVAILACDAELTDAQLTPSGRSKLGQIAALGLSEEAFVMGCCLAIRKEFLDLALPFPVGIAAHDTWLVEIADALGVVQRNSKVLQYYRQHSSNTSKFSANTIHEIGALKRANLWAKSLVRRLQGNGGLSKELASLRLKATRIAEREQVAVMIAGAEHTANAIAMLNHRIERLEARHAVRQADKAERLQALARNWSKSGYHGLAGTAAALRDLTAGKGD
jgi:glycosyltransferase involved in cell wall biosynthesis